VPSSADENANADDFDKAGSIYVAGGVQSSRQHAVQLRIALSTQ